MRRTRHVAEDRSQADPRQSMGGADEGERRHQDLASHAQSPGGKLEARRAAGNSDTVLHVLKGSKAFFKFLHQRTVIREPVAPQTSSPL
jgi:hypothetical protein